MNENGYHFFGGWRGNNPNFTPLPLPSLSSTIILCRQKVKFTNLKLTILSHKKQILTSQIRSEIASSSERAYPNLPISSTKSLLFLESEGAVIEFARSRGWILKDGMIYFPKETEVDLAEAGEDDAAGTGAKEEMSKLVIENALGYARELETIV